LFGFVCCGGLGDGHLAKVVSQDELILLRGEWKRNGRKIVFSSGCFDLLHPGHVRLLEQARDLGDVLIVGVESDASARVRIAAEAGPVAHSDRPLTSVDERMEILAALAAVDYVFEVDLQQAQSVMARLRPDVIVEGGAEKIEETLDADRGAGAGTNIVHIPLEPGHSTTRLIERIKQIPA
jgi:D-beta-D-heptose 7-phosphate kinase/D-beta-D-heptose 1-phosphate adenosyltransferase